MLAYLRVEIAEVGQLRAQLGATALADEELAESIATSGEEEQGERELVGETFGITEVPHDSFQARVATKAPKTTAGARKPAPTIMPAMSPMKFCLGESSGSGLRSSSAISC